MKVITWETLYYEDHGATLKHKCGKRIVTLSLLSFSLIFYFFIWDFSLFYGLFSFSFLGFFGLFYLFFAQSLIPTCSGIIVPIILSSLGQCSNNDDHHTFIYLQLNDYNSILEQSMTLYGCLRRCTGICDESRVTSMKELWTVALPQILCQLHDHASNMAMMNVSW